MFISPVPPSPSALKEPPDWKRRRLLQAIDQNNETEALKQIEQLPPTELCHIELLQKLATTSDREKIFLPLVEKMSLEEFQRDAWPYNQPLLHTLLCHHALSSKVLIALIQRLAQKFPETLSKPSRSSGDTSLHTALANRRPDVSIALIRIVPKEAFTIKNKAGKTPEQLADSLFLTDQRIPIFQAFYQRGVLFPEHEIPSLEAICTRLAGKTPEQLSDSPFSTDLRVPFSRAFSKKGVLILRS